MKRIRVMQITHDLNIGGLQRVVVDLARNIDKERFDVSVCALREGGPLERELLDDGIPVIKLSEDGKRVDYFTFWKLYRIFKAMKPAIIHTHNTQPYLEGTVAALLAGVPAVVHTDHGRQFPDKTRYMIAERIMSRFVRRIVAVSEATKRDLVRYEKIPTEKIMVVANGIDERKYGVPGDRSGKRRELGIEPEAGPLIGWCGRLAPEKGLADLISAVALLTKDFPNLVLLIVGEGELEISLHQKVHERNLGRWIRFVGPRNDVPEIMVLLDLFVLPSLREGLPLVLLEAMAASLPIVATDVGGNADAVVDGVNGVLVKPGDPKGLAAAMKLVLSDKQRLETYAKHSLALFHQRFGLRKILNEYDAIYRDCLAVA